MQPKIHRLLEKKIIVSILSQGKRFRAGALRIRYLNRPSSPYCYIISLSRKVGKANQRNKIKRWVRAAIADDQVLIKKQVAFVIMIRDKIENGLNYKIIKNSVSQFSASL